MSVPLLLVLILISSIICGVVIVICSILVCKYWYKYRMNSRTIRDVDVGKATENNCLLVSNVQLQNQHQLINNNKSDASEDCPPTSRTGSNDCLTSDMKLNDNTTILLNVSQSTGRRHSDNNPYKEPLKDSFSRTRSVSQTAALDQSSVHTDKTLTGYNENEKYRKNSFHLRPFDLAPCAKEKLSYSMELISCKKKSSYEQFDKRKIKSFDSDFIRTNSKSTILLGIKKRRSRELSKSLMSFLQKLSKTKSKTLDEKNILNNNNNEFFNDLDLACHCPFQKNSHNLSEKKGSLESSLYISSLDSSDMNEAFLAVSREIHNSCDSDLCFKSATVKRKQFYREKRKLNNSHGNDNGTSNRQYIQCSSANQSIDRDYSVDEKSSAIFKEFLRNDPNFDKFVMEENVRRRLRSERGFNQHNAQHKRRLKTRVIESCKSASFTDGDPHPPPNILTNSYESQWDNTNRSPSPLPMIVLSSANQFQ